MTQPLTATAASRPCQLYAHTVSPIPSRTQGHHRYPVYLQSRVYNTVRYQELMWLCGLCHDNLHEVLGWMLGESRKPDPMPGRKTVAEARRAYNWYMDACAEAGTVP